MLQRTIEMRSAQLSDSTNHDLCFRKKIPYFAFTF